MKKIYLILFLIVGCLLQVNAQDAPPIFPEDINAQSLSLDKLSRPGLSRQSRGRGLDLGLTQILGSDIVNEKGKSIKVAELKTIQQLTLKLKVPVFLNESLRILVGYSYYPEQFQFDDLGNEHTAVFDHLDGRWLKSQQASLYINN